MIKSLMPTPIHPAGWPFIALCTVITLAAAYLGIGFFLSGLIVTAWCWYFFRDPARVTPMRPGLIVSPADGTILAIKEVVPEAEFNLGNAPYTRISIFLNIFDVHVNRIPATGKIIGRYYRPGKFFNAAFEKASIDNERMVLIIRLAESPPPGGQSIAVVQIAGLIARRILCDAQEGQDVKVGRRFGIIRFGSRVDLYLPQGLSPLVSVGQYMIGGETVIADTTASEQTRMGGQR